MKVEGLGLLDSLTTDIERSLARGDYESDGLVVTEVKVRSANDVVTLRRTDDKGGSASWDATVERAAFGGVASSLFYGRPL